jgi:hypothetical protein
MRADGIAFADICKALGLSRNTVADWFYGERARRRSTHPRQRLRCPRCRPVPGIPDDPAAYIYLLGLYLGDGYLSMTTNAPALRVSCADSWPGIIRLCEEAMLTVLANKVQRVQQQGCVSVQSYSQHWPCLMPQHGPGKKHERRITLTEWQQPIVDEHPGDFLRGLFHSDGCRSTNKIVRGDRIYLYPRYLFVNESEDIMHLCQQSLDRLEIGWRMCRPNMLSVARKGDVAALDLHVGPKT